MPISDSTRFVSAWKGLSDLDKGHLRRAVNAKHADDAVVLRQLADAEAIARRVAELNEEQYDLLWDVCYESGLIFETTDPAYEQLLEDLFRRGLILPHAGDIPSSWFAPLEVRIAVADPDDLSDADLALLLSYYDADERAELASSHQISLDDAADELAQVERIAAGILNSEHLSQLLASLDPESVTLLLWLIQHDGPVAEPTALNWIADDDLHEQPLTNSALTVLSRLGLLQDLDQPELRLLLVPSDLRMQLVPLLTDGFDREAAAAWVALRDGALPSFRDAFPRGMAGSPLVMARYRLLRSISEGPELHATADRMLHEFFLYDPHRQTAGELASFHLDVESPDAFARHILRVWTTSMDDSFTRALISAFDGDAQTIAHWLNNRVVAPEDEAFERQLWLELLVHLRGLLLMCLGCLSAGVWYSLDDLQALMLAIYRRTLWQYGRFRLFTQDFPHEALPVGTEELDESHREALGDFFEDLFEFLLEPIGAAQRDPSGELFLINSEAFRVSRESDHGFDGIWEAAEAVMNEDADLWLPAPGVVGLSRKAPPVLTWHDDGSVSLPVLAHISDLVRLAEWGTVRWEGEHFHFHFTEEDFALEDGEEPPEAFLVWLVIRSASELPNTFRALIPASNVKADLPPAQVEAEARAYVTQLYNALDAWAETPSLALMEELRAWGDVSALVLSEKLAERVLADDIDSPALRHCALILSELGVTSALADMFTIFLRTDDERQEGAIGMAIARLGSTALAPLTTLIFRSTLGVEKRLASVGVLSALAVLHPHLSNRVFQELRRLVRDEEIGDDVATIVCAHVAETGHPQAEALARELRDQGRWFEETLPFDDALWTVATSPSIWGHPIYAGPLAQIFPNAWESEEVLRAAGIDEVMRDAKVERASVLGRIGGWRRRN